MQLKWATKSFPELTGKEVYDMLQLRQMVFVVEQHCPYLDCDEKDFKSYHLMGYDSDKLAAYARLLPAGVDCDEVSIGRVVTHPDVRRGGIGIQLMTKAVEECNRLFGNQPIRISAQKWLKNFYMKSGFEDINLPYYIDGIPHLIMLRK